MSTSEEREYGAPAGVFRALDRARPPGRLFSPRAWKSPLRGLWLTSVFAVVLLVGLPLVTLTGFVSFAAYEPRFEGNGFPRDPGLRLPYFAWPTSPSWLYRLNQAIHVGLGLALVPVVLAKLWSVIPKLFAWPPARSVRDVLDRVGLALLVGSILFELLTGILNIQYDYVFGFDFYTAHYYGAWVFVAAFALHVFLHLGTMVRGLRSRSLRQELRTPLAGTRPEEPDAYGLVAEDPDVPTLSRRGLLGVVAGSSALLTVVTVGQTFGPRSLALLSPRGQSYGDGPNDFQINRTAATARITDDLVSDDWRLVLRSPGREVRLSRADLLGMPQHTAELPIACVEGWSTVQTWTGVRLRDLVAMTGIASLSSGLVSSLEAEGAFARAVLSDGQLTAGDSLLALKVNGADLSRDHGFPARIIVPALPGVHNTKWVREIELRP